MKKSGLKVSTRLSLAFGALFLLFVIGGIVSLRQIGEVNTRISEIVDDGNVKLSLAEDLSRQVFIGVDSVKTMLLVTDNDVVAALAKRGYEAKQRFMRAMST